MIKESKWVRNRAARPGPGRVLVIVALALATHGTNAESSSTVLFATGFEPPEYEVGFTLADQGGWLSDAIGGNQIFDGYFPNKGQHALIGFSKPEGETISSVSVWRPIHFDPIAAGQPLVTFSVTMSIADSVNPALRDAFRWSVYNTNTAPTRLFSLDFDNSDLSLAYLLDDDLGFVVTPFAFERDGLYDLVIRMDFANNRWSATLNDVIFADQLPITTRNAGLHLGDISAVWVKAADNQEFGDNFMVFDDYRIVAASVAPPGLVIMEPRPDGSVMLQLQGETGRTYSIEATSDWINWFPLHTETLAGSLMEYLDTDAASFNHRFYRGRLVQ